MIYQSIISLSGKRKILALLVDPDETGIDSLPVLMKIAAVSGVSMILVGGSLVSNPIDKVVEAIRKMSSLPVLLFPGNPAQLTGKADGILLLSLISGRNAEFLIGHHVAAARFIRSSGLEVIPTGYMLVENGSASSAGYMSNTSPIPREKSDIAVSTAIAGELLGLKVIYMEGGSGANGIIPPATIEAVRKNINIPLIVGGGIRNASDLRQVFDAGADIAVVGNSVEKDFSKLEEFAEVLRSR